VDQPNKQLWGGARERGKRALAVQGSLLSRWVRIFSITTGSSMQAMILTAAPQARQVSMSMPNTRFRRCAHVIETRRSPGVGCGGSPVEQCWLHLPRFAGVTRARYRLLGANTPWKRVRLTLVLGTRAASRAMKSSGSKVFFDELIQEGALWAMARVERRADI